MIMKNLNFLKKIQTIVLSRIKKPKEDWIVEEKRKICKVCNYNSKNMQKIPLSKSILKVLSDFYSWIMGKADEDNLGNCLACESCSIYYKSVDENHCPHPEGDKWWSIYEPNSAQKQKWSKQ